MKKENLRVCVQSLFFTMCVLVIAADHVWAQLKDDAQETTAGRNLGKTLITPDAFEFVGGWRLPSKGAGGRGLGFARGGLFVEHVGEDERQLYIYGHSQAKECHVLSVSRRQIGHDVEQRLSWPVAMPLRLLPRTHTIQGNVPYAICRPNPDGPLLSTGRVFYATEPKWWTGPWMNWYDEAEETTQALSVARSVDRRQVFGGGFCTVPGWFADRYLDGRDFGVGYGGYQSGQTSSPGPSLLVAHRPSDFATQLDGCLELLGYRWGGGKGEREQRPADYTRPLWGPATEGDQGWWQADKVIAGPAWIDTDGRTGLCYWSIQGLGELDYNLQDTAFSKKRRVRLYVYDPSMLAEVAAGRLRPHQVRGDYYEWPLPFDDSPNANRWPIGAYWDAQDQLLYMAYRNSGGGKYEVPPVVVLYRIN